MESAQGRLVVVILALAFGLFDIAAAHAELASDAKLSGWNWQAIGIMATTLIGVTGFLATYANNLVLEQRRAKVDVVNRQLENLYGPLLALSNSTEQAWLQFRNRWRKGRPFFLAADPPSEDDVREFRHWMNIVLMPANLKMQDIITTNAHLIDGSAMPREFLEFLAHVQAYQAVIAKWKPDDSGPQLMPRIINVSYVNHPKRFNAYIAETFNELKARQSALLTRSVWPARAGRSA